MRIVGVEVFESPIASTSARSGPTSGDGRAPMTEIPSRRSLPIAGPREVALSVLPSRTAPRRISRCKGAQETSFAMCSGPSWPR